MSHSDNVAPIRGHRSEMPLFYDDEFYTGFTTHENGVEVDQDVLQIKKGSRNFEKYINKTWKGFMSACKSMGIEVDDKYKFF